MDAASLRSTIKSARDLMRKDAGLNTDVDRIPQLAWMLFLKCFDDFEKKRSALDKKYKLAIPQGYTWSDWAKNKKLTGDDLIKFVNDDLFPKLAGLVGGTGFEQRDIISAIFRDLNNRVLSGYVLRQIIDIIDQVDFVSSDEIHTMAKLYEDMLVEMRDAAGSNGEFYTPRPVIRFMVEQVKPDLKKSETVLDPACGTGGFLIESLDYMKKDEKSKSDYEKLRYHTLFGTDKKPMPYLLCMMNLLLHEVDKPNVVRGNPLARPFREISEREQYDVIVTNPPFGGEEEAGLSANLPIGMQTSDTALSFLLFILLSLKEKGRCAIILPNGPLFAGGVAAKIKEKLLSEFNLHTIIRLPETVFEPYTTVATNILFFDNGKPTKEIWYYSMKVDERLRGVTRAKNPKYTKSNPIIYEDFSDIISWMKKKTDNDNAWKVSIDDIKDFNLDIKNPNDKEEVIDLSPHELIDTILKDEEKTLQLLREVKELIKKEIPK